MANALLNTDRTDAYAQLTDRQRAFVEAYIGRANGNGSMAAKLAGYSTVGSAIENLKNPIIQKAIEERYAEHRITADEIISRLAEQARGAHASYIKADKDGRLSLDTKGLIESGLARNIKRIADTKHGQTIEFYDAQAALALLGKGLGLLRERVEVTVGGDTGALLERLRATIAAAEAALPAGEVVEAEFTVEGE